MKKQNFHINNLQVASPCSVGWDSMSGDERVRHCHSCKLNIYNIVEMTNWEVENLIANRENKVCIRLFKRADGTVLTKDCPIGLRSYQKRAARLAGAALTTILSLFSVSFGQKEDKKSVDASKMKILRIVYQKQESILIGTVFDSNGAIIPGAKLKLYKKGEKKFKTKSDTDGKYFFSKVSAGTYILETEVEGFTNHKFVELKVKNGEEISFDIKLQPANTTVTVGIYVSEPLIDINSSSITKKITREIMDKLPL